MLKLRSTKLMCLLIAFIWTTVIIGSSYAYFIDSVTVTGNVIAAGNLKVGLEYKDKNGEWQDASDATIFNYQRWEPGYTDVQYIRMSNMGDLAFQYELNIVPDVQTALMDVIDVYFGEVEAGYSIKDRTTFWEQVEADNLEYVGTMRDLLNNGSNPHGLYGADTGVLLKGESKTACIVLHMQEEAGNEYQKLSVGEGFKLQMYATQYMYETDSFGKDYDEGAESKLPELNIPTSMTIQVQPVNGRVPSAVIFKDPVTGVSATVPAGAKMAAGAKALSLIVSPMTNSQADIDLDKGEVRTSYNVKIDGLAEDNIVPAIINMGEVLPKGLNMGNYTLYHVENGNTVKMNHVDTPAAHNDFAYNPATGEVTVAMATFSEVTLVSDKEAKWEGNYDYSWYNPNARSADYTIANADQLAAFGAIVGGMNGQTQDSFAEKNVKLVADVNLGDAEKENNPDIIFYPIGYYNSTGSYEKTSGGSVTSSVSSFEGTFDGNGHIIKNFYQNTWEMFGDYNDGYSGKPNHYKDAMGLFGYVLNGTVKNLTVDNFSSDGEYTPTGVIAAYADGDSTFENIAITNCNPRVYNTGNGGIIGIAGDTSASNDDHITLKNITVDNSNKISALWGSYDVACGGLVGMYRGNVDGSGNATDDTISFENCHVAAQIDVYNDVCANYQYYAYRYAGMMIGSVRHNEVKDGKTIPNMAGITAKDCTVNYGDWNDYYYCEFEKNTMASYSEDYQFSRVPHSELNFTDSNGNGVVDADERASVTGCKHTHTAEENHQAVYLPFHQLFTGYSWGVSSIGLEKYSGIVTNLDITEGDQQESVEKFVSKFTGDFLYRVGNQNTVVLDSLFKAKEGVTINPTGVYVTIDKVDENMNVSGKYTASTTKLSDETIDWTKGTIQCSGTGVVKVTIQDYNFCKPTVLELEVVDAVNVTGATSATANNVVLLNDCGFSSLEVSGGYTLFGNGFTMTCGSDSAALDMGYSFVTLDNGTLDNVQIVCPNFDYAVLYKSNMTESGNRSETTDRTRYYNVKSGVMVSGNSQILNSRISGGRAAVNVTGGNCLIDNSRIELGAVASLLVGAANSLTLRDVTLVQKPTASTYDSSKTLMGFSVLFVCDANGDTAPVTLEGTLVQNAWVNESDKQYVPSAGQSIISTVLGKTEYLHDIDGDGTKESLNLGFAYMPESLTSKVNTTTITDNRTNKNDVSYDYAEVSILNGKTYVYSYKNTNGTADSFKTESEYEPNKYSDIITVTYSDTKDGLESGKSFGTDGWVYELNVDLDKLSGYKLDFSKLSMSVNGVTVSDFEVNGDAKPASPVAATAGGATYTLTATVNDKEYTATFKVTGTETSKESPSKISGPTAEGFGVAKSYGDDWSGAADVLTGVKIKYWSVAENKYIEYDFSNFTVPGNAGKLNGSNSYWEYTHTNNDFTLKVTNTVAIHSGKSVYGMPIRGIDGKLYFTISTTNGYVGSGTKSRAITMQYEFNDNNGGEKLTFTHTFNISYSKDKQYSYSDLSGSGKLTKLEASSGSSGCVTPDTLITLANGTQVRVDNLTGNEKLLVWNLETGMLDEADIMFVDNDPKAEYDVIHLYFSDGTDVKVIYEHGFWDYNLNKYVYLDKDAEQYIGHTFAKQNGNELAKVKLTEVVIEKAVTTAWSPVTADHLCYFVNGMLSMPGGVGGLFNIFDVDAETMTYDMEALARDIETYGLFTYEELNAIVELPEEMFKAAGGAYLKVSIGKGNLTMDELVYMIERYTKYFK